MHSHSHRVECLQSSRRGHSDTAIDLYVRYRIKVSNNIRSYFECEDIRANDRFKIEVGHPSLSNRPAFVEIK